MREDMAEFLNAMTLGDLDTFEEIISHQYKKFVKFYKIVKKFASSIERLKYEFDSSESLNVVITLEDDADRKAIKSHIQKSIDGSKYEGNVRMSKSNLYISLTLVEA